MDQPLSAFMANRLRGCMLPLEFGQLVASIGAAQAASPTGVAATLLGRPVETAPTPLRALVTLFSAAPGWAPAVALLGGRFHPGVPPHPDICGPIVPFRGASMRRQEP